MMTAKALRRLSTVYIVMAPVALYYYYQGGAWMMLFTAVMFCILCVMLRVAAKHL